MYTRGGIFLSYAYKTINISLGSINILENIYIYIVITNYIYIYDLIEHELTKS
jgi:hypothetical protein